MIAITNSGPLVVLAKLNQLHLLSSLFDEVLIPREVYNETVMVGQQRSYPDAKVIQSFLKDTGSRPVKPSKIPSELNKDNRLGRGEIEAIALAREHRTLLLIDEIYARKVARQMSIKTIGSLGILVEAHQKGYLLDGVFEALLNTIESREDIWIHPRLCHRVRREVLGK